MPYVVADEKNEIKRSLRHKANRWLQRFQNAESETVPEDPPDIVTILPENLIPFPMREGDE